MTNGKDDGKVTEQVTLPNNVAVTLRLPRGSDHNHALDAAGMNAALVPTFEALLCVVALDGQPEPLANTRAKLDSLSDRLGYDGVDVVCDWHRTKTFPELRAAIDELGGNATPQQVFALAQQRKNARLKNSPQTQ